MDKLEAYVERMDLKKRTMGGLDEDDVKHHIGELCRLAREENQDLKEQLKSAQEELKETQGKLKHYRVAYRDQQKGTGRTEPDREEIRKRNDAYDKMYQEMAAAAETLLQAKKDAEHIVRRQMKEELAQEARKVRSRLQEEIRQNRRLAEEKLKGLQEQIQELEQKKRDLEGSIRDEQDRWRQHIGWIIQRLGLKESDFLEAEIGALSLEQAEDIPDSELDGSRPGGTRAHRETGQETGDQGRKTVPPPELALPEPSQNGYSLDLEEGFPELIYPQGTDWNT